jgi:phosphoserine phosphatase
VSIEGIDVLAAGNPEIAELTAAAMDGRIPLDEVYGRRLELVRPSLEAVLDLAQQYLSSLLPGARETIAALHDAAVEVHLVTAGIEQAIAPLAEYLRIPPRCVHAVRLSFDGEGNYRDFDRGTPLVRSDGKELVVLDVRARTKGKAALIGDGATDAEARKAVELFIGFGGVTIRDRVRDLADVYVTEPDLTSLLPLLLLRNDG